MTTAIFFLFAITAIVAAIAVVFQKNPVNSCLWLVLSFFALAGLYILLGAPFIAAIQIIVYAGAIMVLFLFVIMLLNLTAEIHSHAKRPRFLPFAVAAGILLFIEMALVYRKGPGMTLATHADSTSVEVIGIRLFTDFIYPFELSSVLILAAIMGAVMLAKRKI